MITSSVFCKAGSARGLAPCNLLCFRRYDHQMRAEFKTDFRRHQQPQDSGRRVFELQRDHSAVLNYLRADEALNACDDLCR